MHLWDEKPVFCFTSDIDWASEEVIQLSHETLSGNDLKLTYFNTHPSQYLAELHAKNHIKLLIHPNFLPDSSHGNSYQEVIDYCQQLVPDADGFRCHRYFEVNDIMDDFAKRGFQFVSNHCTRCEAHIKPLWHRSGLLSLPIFLEDGGYLLMDPSLNFDQLTAQLNTPGLKIINFHPAHMAFNTPNFFFTRTIKDSMSRAAWNQLSCSEIKKVAYNGHGIRSVIQRIIDFVFDKKHSLLSIHEVNEHYRLP